LVKNYLAGYLENQVGITGLGLLLGIRLRPNYEQGSGKQGLKM